MRKGSSESKPLEVREAKALWPRVLLVLLVLSPLLRDLGLILFEKWRPFTGVGPEPGYSTPVVDVIKKLWGGGSRVAGNSAGSVIDGIFSSPTISISILLSIAGLTMLLMKGGARRT